MADASHFDTGVRIAPILGRHKKPIRLVTVLTHFGGSVKAITQHEKEGALFRNSPLLAMGPMIIQIRKYKG